MTLKQVSVFLENRSGSIMELTGVLAEAGINIRAFSIADTSDFGVVRLIVDNPELASSKVTENGMLVSITNVLAVKLDDVPGSLYKALKVLSEAGITIEYSYAFFTPEDGPFAIIRVADNETATKILEKAGFPKAFSEDFYE